MGANFTLRVDLSEVLEALHGPVSAILPQLSKGVEMTAKKAVSDWQEAVGKAHLRSGEKEFYLKSIHYGMVSAYAAEVVSDYKLADEIETGRPPKDLKKCLPTARKARRVKQGKHAGQKYLIIPFRHNTPGQTALARDMPDHIYKRAKALDVSKLLAAGSIAPKFRISATGHKVEQHSYQWGGRLPAGLAPKLKPHHVTDIYAGMVKMDTRSGKQKSSAYMTFRTMGEWSQHWIVPRRPGLFILRDVAGQSQRDLDVAMKAVIGAAVKGVLS